ncbi:(2Fe-2S)-binding protein [Clostridium magnum]|uniref:BFD-like [2Fe-2S] binding domain protein n=1 Tax=Clostridium magnum DSM 2767 TaxID=1121326 RepID=A0A162S7A0_9CLOT|nr:(2Fe-2S)-binding protein [Clostridium magnum]KZL90869.1 BFD-like [2Fe-2S] binding domain protein [Clostridium magnum DSM 2767]SHI12427.1 BFD-like [2Fe-2S] binding domain-containing protein [Clostridium magnum DSM 2767]
MEQNIKPEILDKLTKVCICKGISRATIKNAILNGATTIEEVKKSTGAGSGSCVGKRCTPKIEQLLEELK